MKKFANLLSPISWAVIYLGSWGSIFAVFRPSLKDVGIFAVIDLIAFAIVRFILDPRLFKTLPDAKLFFNGVNWDGISALDHAGRANLLTTLFRFPKVRAVYATLVSFLKMLPGFAVVTFYWDHDRSYLAQFLLIFGVGVIANSYFYTAVLLENHDEVSKTIRAIHERFDFTKVFAGMSVEDRDRNPVRVSNAIASIAIWVFTIGIEIVVLMADVDRSKYLVIFELVAISLLSLTYFSRMRYLESRLVLNRLEEIISAFESFNPMQQSKAIAIHSLPLLARFDMTFNALSQRLKDYEKELSGWIFSKADESRYLALGEISGLVIHDLSAPLHVLSFCIGQMKEDPNIASNPAYVAQMVTNSDRTLQLVSSLREYIRGSQTGLSPSESFTTSIGEAWSSVCLLLESQFQSRGFLSISLSLDPAAQPQRLGVTKPDLIHVLVNLIGNACDNLLTHQIKMPTVQLNLGNVDASKATFYISDNGTGLNPERFESLTAFAFTGNSNGETGKPTQRPAMGLRLVRRLIERYGGHLSVCSVAKLGTGTSFELTLPLPEKPEIEA